MAHAVDYYLTPVSPWAYLGHDRFARLLRETGSTVDFVSGSCVRERRALRGIMAVSLFLFCRDRISSLR